MEEFRSKSYGDGRMQIESYDYNGTTKSDPIPAGLQDLRCYSASYASSSSPNNNIRMGGLPKEAKFKKGKSSNGSSSSRNWSLGDPELQRKKRVASYKAYAVEGKVKGSIRKSFKWIKERCSKVIYGWR